MHVNNRNVVNMKHDQRFPLFAGIQSLVHSCTRVAQGKRSQGTVHFITTTVPSTYCSTTPRRNTTTAVELYSYRVPWSRILYS